jgi:hypothetical protein
MKFGAACSKCGAYFVADREQVRMCPWCERIESGGSESGLYEFPEGSTEDSAGP